MSITTAQEATVLTTSQLVPVSGFVPAYGLPRVRELPLRLEPVGPDTFGGLVINAVVSPTNHPRGALS